MSCRDRFAAGGSGHHSERSCPGCCTRLPPRVGPSGSIKARRAEVRRVLGFRMIPQAACSARQSDGSTPWMIRGRRRRRFPQVLFPGPLQCVVGSGACVEQIKMCSALRQPCVAARPGPVSRHVAGQVPDRAVILGEPEQPTGERETPLAPRGRGDVRHIWATPSLAHSAPLSVTNRIGSAPGCHYSIGNAERGVAQSERRDRLFNVMTLKRHIYQQNPLNRLIPVGGQVGGAATFGEVELRAGHRSRSSSRCVAYCVAPEVGSGSLNTRSAAITPRPPGLDGRGAWRRCVPDRAHRSTWAARGGRRAERRPRQQRCRPGSGPRDDRRTG